MASDRDDEKTSRRRREKDDKGKKSDDSNDADRDEGKEARNRKRKQREKKSKRDRDDNDDDNNDRRARRETIKKDNEEEEEDERGRQRKSRKDDDEEEEDSSGSNESSEERRRERRKRRRRKERKHKKEKKKRKSRKRRRRDDSSSSSEDSSSSSSSESSEEEDRRSSKRKKLPTTTTNPKLLAKLQARGETLEERRQRRAARSEQKRAAFISTKFGYTAEDNPFHDPNLHQAFTWKKRQEKQEQVVQEEETPKEQETATGTLEEIEKLRSRRKQRELQLEEMERIRREESRMKELENFDEWARKEEDFHLQQQRQRSAIRLVQGREKPIDVLAKNMLMFGVDQENRAAVKYKERYNALEELSMNNLDVELDQPHKLLHMLKLHELEETLTDINAFLTLEREASGPGTEGQNPILTYWLALKTVALDEIKFLQSGGENGEHAKTVAEVCKIFQQGQSKSELEDMRSQIAEKTTPNDQAAQADEKDSGYWETVLEQLDVFLAKQTLSEIHSQMLVRQLERLEQKRNELAKMSPEERQRQQQEAGQHSGSESKQTADDDDNEDGLEEKELAEELEDPAATSRKTYSWADKYRPRKPRYFNRVKTGYDWNKYNKTHYDRDNPPPKTVQGYKFNIFYPDLIDPSKTPKFELLKADSDEFCIIRFSAGPPYEDVAFKIINREWNRSRKHGFKSTFERGILSLYFNFKTKWYRR